MKRFQTVYPIHCINTLYLLYQQYHTMLSRAGMLVTVMLTTYLC